MTLPHLSRRLLIALALVSTLAGCANTHLKRDTISDASLSPTSGVLVGSFARHPASPAYYSQTFYFKNLANGTIHQIKSQQEFNIFNGKTPDDFDTPESKGGVFAFNLPAGRYTLFNFRLFEGKGFGYRDFRSREDFSIPFEVRANATNYIGEIKLQPLMMGRSFLFNTPEHSGGVWYISDQIDRDLAILRKTRPEVPTGNVTSVIPQVKEVFTPLVILPKEQETLRQKAASARPPQIAAGQQSQTLQ
jgi:hypothetical protein